MRFQYNLYNKMKKLKLLLLILPIFVLVFLFKTAVTASAACSEGAWRYDCSPATAGPCPANACVGLPQHCENGQWVTTNPMGECTPDCTNCSHDVPPPGGNYCIAAGYHDCTGRVGQPAGTCQKNNQTCAAFETYECNFDDGTGRKDYCGPPFTPNAQSCVCGGSSPAPSRTPSPSRSPSPSSAPPGNRSCSVSWNLPNSNPAPNSGMTVEVTGNSDTGGWQNIQLSRDNQNVCPQGAGCGLNIIQPGPKFIFSNVNSGSSGSHTLSFATDNGATKCPQTTTYTAGGGSSTTVSYRTAENPADLAAAPWQDYTDTVASTPFDYTFKDPKPGQKFIFVQFMGSNGIPTTTVDCPKCQVGIKLLGPDPVMTRCSLSFENSNAILHLTGQNFGSTKGTIKSGDTDLAIRSWKDDSIQAILQNAPTGQVLPVTFVNTDGQTGSDQCSSISQLTLGAKVFCRAPASYDTDNVDLTLVDETGKKMRQTVRIDKKGVVQGLTQRLEDGKRYELSLKAPKSLRRNVPFTSGDGTVSIPNFVLPVGDIFPLDGGDGVINALDKGELNREWNISGNATGRLGDFNQDGRVNSIDWACMRYDFGQLDDPEATIPPPPSPSPAPSASASVSPSPRASVSPSPSPNPSP